MDEAHSAVDRATACCIERLWWLHRLRADALTRIAWVSVQRMIRTRNQAIPAIQSAAKVGPQPSRGVPRSRRSRS